MTSEQKQNLDKKITQFKSFMDFHKFAYDNNIIFEHDEWIEIKNILSGVIEKYKYSESSTTSVHNDLSNLILPNYHTS